MKNYLFRLVISFLTLLCTRKHLWLITAISGSLALNPIYATSTTKRSESKTDNNKETSALKTGLKQMPKSMLKSSKKPRSKQDGFVKEQMGELWRSSAQLGLSAGLVFGLYQFSNKPFDLSTLIAPVVGNLLTDPIKAIGTSCALLLFPSLSKPKLNEAMGIKKQYEAKKDSFSPSMQIFIEQILNDHIWRIQRFDYYDHKYAAVLKELLQFPVRPKQVVPDTGVIHQFMRNYPEEVRLSIGEFVAAIVEDAKSNQLTKKSTPIMFVGPPGTGKTYLARHLADLLKLPVQSIDVSSYKNIYGARYYSSDPEKGIIAEALIGSPSQEQNWSNKIVVLDEIDKALAIDKDGKFIAKNGSEVYSFLHTFLETQEVAIPLARYDNARPNISQLKIILIANKTFTETLTPEKAATLESRIKVIRFDQGFTPERKKAIVVPYVDKLLAKKGMEAGLFKQDVVDAIIAEDTRLGLKGVRVLLSMIDRYIDSLKHQKLVHEIAGLPIAPFNVEQAYAPYQPKPVASTNDGKLLNKK